MAGGIIIAVLLLLAPFIIVASMSAVAALLGWALKSDAETRHADSELLETNY